MYLLCPQIRLADKVPDSLLSLFSALGVLDMDMDRTEEDGGFDSQDEDDVRDILEVICHLQFFSYFSYLNKTSPKPGDKLRMVSGPTVNTVTTQKYLMYGIYYYYYQ